MRGRRWTTHERNTILDMWAAGRHVDEIAGVVQGERHSVQSVVRIARRNGDTRAIDRYEREATVCPNLSSRIDAPLLCPELGIEAVTRFIPNAGVHTSTGGLSFVPVSLPRLRCLEGWE